MIGGQAEFARQFRNVDIADQHIRETAENAESSQQYWDVVWEFKASQDYDPVEDLEKVQASLLTLNFTDDQINGIGFDLTGEICAKWNERESTWRKSGSCPSRGTNQSRS
jgi:hypothetical protein